MHGKSQKSKPKGCFTAFLATLRLVIVEVGTFDKNQRRVVLGGVAEFPGNFGVFSAPQIPVFCGRQHPNRPRHRHRVGGERDF